jgi:hypothetical protein
VIWMVSVCMMPEYMPDYTGMSSRIITGLSRNNTNTLSGQRLLSQQIAQFAKCNAHFG